MLSEGTSSMPPLATVTGALFVLSSFLFFLIGWQGGGSVEGHCDAREGGGA